MHPELSEKYQQICNNISLNIPDQYSWQWDEKFHTTIVVIEKFNQDIIFFPITQEFDHRWDFASFKDSGDAFYQYFINRFGIIPGQILFTAGPNNDWKLFAIWWPWGDDEKISLRVGLFDNPVEASNPEQIRTMLTQWFKI